MHLASCSLGGAAFCFDKAKEYLKTRKQFGKALSEFQYLQFKLADMATDLTASREMVRKAARMMDVDVRIIKKIILKLLKFFYKNKHKDKTMYAAMAKQFATDKCFDVNIS